MVLKTITKYTADSEFESVNESGNIVKMDMHPREQKNHHSPMELLLSAAAGCAAVDVVEILKKKRKTVKSLYVETEGIRREELPRKFTQVIMNFILDSPDTSIEELEKVVAMSVDKYCSVAASLTSEVKVDYHSKISTKISL
jgi:putative redox protein